MAYFYLALGIIGELVGTMFLKYSEGFSKLIPSIMTVLAYCICFFFLSKSLLYINLSVVYATWCALGIVGATLLSVFLFNEQLNISGIIGILLVVTGIVVLNLYGTSN